jgi:hypothetical protein
VILDPQPGDIGVATFCSRDISSVKAAAAQSAANGMPIQPQNPGSFRTFDWADGVYWGSFLGPLLPAQYVQVNTAGITVVSPTQITLQAPTITITASDALNMTATNSALLNSPANTISGGSTSIDGKPFLPHEHVNGGGTGNSGVVA